MSEGIGIRLQIDEKQLDEWRAHLRGVAKPEEINRAVSRAINRALENVRTVSAKGVRDQYTVKSKAVKDAQRLNLSSPKNLSGSVVYTGPAISLRQFKVKPGKPFSWKGIPNPKRTKQLFVEIKKGEAKEYKGGFLQSMNFGAEPSVWSRTGKSRFPIKKQLGPAIAGMITESGVAEKALESGNEIASRRIDHEIAYMLGRK